MPNNKTELIAIVRVFNEPFRFRQYSSPISRRQKTVPKFPTITSATISDGVSSIML